MTSGLVPGLCSVTFRQLAVDEVARRAADAGLATVEWGGDVHVPPGDLAAAERARAATEAAGLTVASYGSYLFLDDPARVRVGLDPVLATAEALGTTLVRVWCPFGVLAVDDRAADDPGADVLGAARVVAEVAGERGIDVYVEHHGGTLTATPDGVRAVLGASGVWCGWQPPYWAPLDDAGEAASIAAVGPRLGHVHVYAWDPPGPIRRPLAAEADRWRARLAAVAGAVAPADTADPPPTFARAALVEFVVDDDPAHLAADAATLLALLADDPVPEA